MSRAHSPPAVKPLRCAWVMAHPRYEVCQTGTLFAPLTANQDRAEPAQVCGTLRLLVNRDQVAVDDRREVALERIHVRCGRRRVDEVAKAPADRADVLSGEESLAAVAHPVPALDGGVRPELRFFHEVTVAGHE